MEVRDQIIEFCSIFELQLMSFSYDIEYGDFIFRVYPKRNSPLYRNFRISDAFSEFDEFIVEYTGFNSINNILILEFDDDAKVTQIKFSDYINKLKQELDRQGWEYVDGEWVKSMI